MGSEVTKSSPADELSALRQRADKAASLLAAIVASSDDAIVSKTLDGVIMSWNSAAERLFGYTAEEVVGKNITSIIPADRRDEETLILEQIKRGERVDHFETVRVRKDGALLDISLTFSPIKNAADRIVGASKVARDITERKRSERMLAEQARLLDLSNDAILVRDVVGRLTYWNKGAEELYGYTREEVMGQILHDLLRTQFPEPQERIRERLEHENRWTGELIQTRKDDTQVIVFSRWALDRGPLGNPDSILETDNDATQLKRSEKALRESEERLRALVDNLETEVQARTRELEQRNIKVFQQSQRLQDLSRRLLQTQEDERRRIARELHDSAGQTLTAVSIGLARLTQEAQQRAPKLAKDAEEIELLVQQLDQDIRTTSYLLHPPLLDESGLAVALSGYVRGLAERSGLDITLSIPEGFESLPRDMELVVFRLVQECLTNIHRHSGSKNAAVRIAREGEKISIEVEDHGTGISAERLAEIQSRGTGVGIRGMRERVHQFRGEMNIESCGSGTKVSVTFPAP